MIEFPQIDPVALQIGPLAIRWYALAYLAGILLGWRYILAQLTEGERPNKEDIDDLISWLIIGIILGGRLGYVLFYNAEYYAQYPLEALKVWQGGMAFHGGMIGVFVTMLAFSHIKKLPFLQLSDLICAAAPIGLFFGRIANFINGGLYGRFTDHPFGMVFPHGGPATRHPSQLYEAALEGLALFLILLILKRLKAPTGVISGTFLLGYGVFRFMIEYVREPDAHIGLLAFDLSMGQLLCLPMIILGAGVILYAYKRHA